MKRTTTIRIRVTKNESQYLGECLEYPVMTHGRNLEELTENMEKALQLFLADEGEGGDVSEADTVIAVRIELPEGLC